MKKEKTGLELAIPNRTKERFSKVLIEAGPSGSSITSFMLENLDVQWVDEPVNPVIRVEQLTDYENALANELVRVRHPGIETRWDLIKEMESELEIVQENKTKIVVENFDLFNTKETKKELKKYVTNRTKTLEKSKRELETKKDELKQDKGFAMFSAPLALGLVAGAIFLAFEYTIFLLFPFTLVALLLMGRSIHYFAVQKEKDEKEMIHQEINIQELEEELKEINDVLPKKKVKK
ncbi:MAG: hypothetical protein JXA43_03565 [Candidatus Diapherotrites archaeon]|nr:hypothetical protein [Candidatus Diapherotrites archaeon]